MTAALIVVVAVVALVLQYLQLADERKRTARLLELLEAKAAPQQFYSLDDTPPDDSQLQVMWDDTGLIARYVPFDEVS